MINFTTETYKSVVQIAKSPTIRSWIHVMTERLFRHDCEDIQYCNGIVIGKKGTKFIFYNTLKSDVSTIYGPVTLSSIGGQLIKKVRVTAEQLVFLTEAGAIYDLLAEILHDPNNLKFGLERHFRMHDVKQCVDVETSRLVDSVVLMKSWDGHVYGVGINDKHQLADRDNTYGLREANLVYPATAGPFTTGYDFTVCSSNRKILVCGDNSNQKLGVSDQVSIKEPTVAIQWRSIFGQVKTLIGLRTMVVMLTDHNVYVSGTRSRKNRKRGFRALELSSVPVAIFGDASSNVFYVATASDLYTFDAQNGASFLDVPHRLPCGKESYPTVSFVDKLVYVSFDNFHVAQKMRRMYDLLQNIGLVTYRLESSLEPATKKFKYGVPLIAIPLSDIDVIAFNKTILIYLVSFFTKH